MAAKSPSMADAISNESAISSPHTRFSGSASSESLTCTVKLPSSSLTQAAKCVKRVDPRRGRIRVYCTVFQPFAFLPVLRSTFVNRTRQRVPGAFVESANFLHPKAGFSDQEIRAWQHRGGQLFDHEAHRLRGSVEPLVLGAPLGPPAAAHEQLGRSAVIEPVQITRLPGEAIAGRVLQFRLTRHALFPAGSACCASSRSELSARRHISGFRSPCLARQ